MPAAFYLPDGDLLVPTPLTVGPWSHSSQHGGPPSAVLARALERCQPRDGWRLARVTVEILSPIPLEPLRATATLVRPGRNVEMLEARLTLGGDRDVARARAWRMRTTDLGFAVGDDGPLPEGPEGGAVANFFPGAAEVGYHTAMDMRFVEGNFDEPGPARAWLRQRQPLVAGEDTTPLQRLLVVADAGNGLSASIDFTRYLFVNTDLTVQVLRPIDGEWVSMTSRTLIGPDGTGVASSTIGDRLGVAGVGTQTLFVTARER